MIPFTRSPRVKVVVVVVVDHLRLCCLESKEITRIFLKSTFR